MKKTLLKTCLLTMLFSMLTTTMSAFTAVTSGNWTDPLTWGGVAPGSAVSAQDIIIPAGINVTLDTDVSFTGLLNNIEVSGTLTSAGATGVSIDQGTFTGSGTVDVEWITFNMLGTYSFSGTLTANRFKNGGAALVIASVVNVSDTLNLDAGSILLNAGANVTPMANSTIRVNNGTMTIGGGIFNTGSAYNVMYVGTSKTTGIEINTTMLDHLHVMLNDNTQVLTLGANLTVNNVFHLTTGTIDLSGRSLTLKNDVMAGAGAMITSNTLTDLTIMGTATLTNGLAFTAGSALRNFTIDLSNAGASVMLMSPLNVAGYLNLNDGDLALQTGSTLTMNAGSTIHVEDGMLVTGSGMFVGTAAYNLEYMGGSMTTNDVAMGTGLTNLTINLSPSTGMVTLGSDVEVLGVFTLTSGKLVLNGHGLDFEGTFNQSATTAIVADAASELGFALSAVIADTVYFEPNSMVDELVIENMGATPIVFASPLKIVSTLEFVSGKLALMNGDLTIMSTGSIIGYSEARYVITAGIGKLQMHVNTASPYVVFPVGTTTNYSPASIQQTTFGTSGNFKIGTVNEVFSTGLTGTNIASTNSMVARTWFIEADPAVSVYANIKLGWLPASEVNGFDRTDAYVSHYTTMWDTYTESAATAGPNGTYELVRPNVTVLNTAAFAVMDTTAVIGIEEISDSDLVLFPNPAQETVTLKMKDQSEVFMVEIFDISGKTVMTIPATETGKIDVSGLTKGSYFIKASGKNTGKVFNRRFIKA